MEEEILWHHGPDHSHGRCIECALLRLLDAERANSEGLRKALTALYEACERRANEEGGDFGAALSKTEGKG